MMKQLVDGDTIEVLTLSLDEHRFAVEASSVREILDLVAITEVPASDPFVAGLINVRGKVVPLADLRVKFGMPYTEPTVDTRIVVVEIDVDGDETTVGLVADRVHEVTELATTMLEETPRIGLRWRAEYIHCIAKRDGEFIVVLNLGTIFSVEGDRREPKADAAANRPTA
jgi:purine-binding chemotaxis protein CheW